MAQPGALPELWLQAKLTIWLQPFPDKIARLFVAIAAELLVKGRGSDIRNTFEAVARSFTIRLAEQLARYLSSLMRHAKDLATPLYIIIQ